MTNRPQVHAQSAAPRGSDAGPVSEPLGVTPGEAFDTLYALAAPALVHQTYLLTGRSRLARESVERAFQLAWGRWPEVASDPDPAGWVRAAAYEYAMSPWHRLRRSHRHPDNPADAVSMAPATAEAAPLRAALLALPPVYRRALLLYDGLGVGLPETAAETEASTSATAARLVHARAAVAARLPGLRTPAVLREHLGILALTGPGTQLPTARDVRTGCELRARFWTRLTVGCVVVLAAVTSFALATAPTHYARPTGPPQRVEGVPPRGGPEKLTAADKKLRKKLSGTEPHGPGRLVPQHH